MLSLGLALSVRYDMRAEIRALREMVSAAYFGVQILYCQGTVPFVVEVVIFLVVIYSVVITVVVSGQL